MGVYPPTGSFFSGHVYQVYAQFAGMSENGDYNNLVCNLLYKGAISTYSNSCGATELSTLSHNNTFTNVVGENQDCANPWVIWTQGTGFV